jgi:MYXO-CTERM domain-containing protein
MVGQVARVSTWQYDIDIDYIKSIGGVAKCFNPAARSGTPDIGAYRAGAVTTVMPGSCVPPVIGGTGGTSGAGGATGAGGAPGTGGAGASRDGGDGDGATDAAKAGSGGGPSAGGGNGGNGAGGFIGSGGAIAPGTGGSPATGAGGGSHGCSCNAAGDSASGASLAALLLITAGALFRDRRRRKRA